MRTEAEIFSELKQVCVAPGYAHALAFFCIRDSVVRYSEIMTHEDLTHLFSPEHLVRTEIATLLGMMVQGKMDISRPSSGTIQKYIDQTEELLAEIHNAMLEGTVSRVQDAFISGAYSNPFEEGQTLREPIFYCGESAYSFQYRDLAAIKYQKDDLWMRQNKRFSLRDASKISRDLAALQNNKFSVFSNYLQDVHPDEWTLLPSFMFTASELSVQSGASLMEVRAILEAFSIPNADKNAGFNAIGDFNSVTASPIIPIGDDTYILFEQYSFYQSLYESPFYWMVGDNSYTSTAMKHRGEYVEEFAAQRLTKIFGVAKVHQNITIRGAKGITLGEIDVLVEYGDRAIVVQCKSKRLTLEARRGNDNMIRKDFKASVQDAYDQGLSCAKLLEAGGQILVTSNGKELKCDRKLKEIFLFCITADHYPAITFQVSQFLKYSTSAVIRPPYILDVFQLDTLTEMLETPLHLLSFIKRRTTYHEKLHAENELVILSYHLKRNLWFDNEFNFVALPEDIVADLDLAMMVRREGVPGSATPDGILTRLKETYLGKILRQIEEHADPNTLDLGFALLILSEDTVQLFSQNMERASLAALRERSHHDLTLPMGMSSEGLTIHFNSDNQLSSKGKLEYHCRVRKYRSKAARWYGLCLVPGTEDIKCAIMLAYDWKYDAAMEAEIAAGALRGQHIKLDPTTAVKCKIGRNESCPCGSGRKFKRCCLLN